MAKKKSFWVRQAEKQLKKDHSTQKDEQLYLLSEQEVKSLHKIKVNTYIKVGLAGFLGIALLYVPYHIWGEVLFPKRDVWIPLYNNTLPLEIEFIAYSLVLVFLEIWYLTYVNIQAVSKIAKTCGSPNPNDPNYAKNLESLVNVSLSKKQKDLEKLGINPYEGLSKWGVIVFQFLIRLKATVSGFLWKLIVAKILGRYAFRMLVDLLGGPLYAFWNILASRKIMNETRVRVMAPPLINRFSEQLYDEFRDNSQFKKVLYDILHSISTSKRSFHYNHFLLATVLLSKFEIEVNENTDCDPDFLSKIDQLPKELHTPVAKLLVFGIIIDGGLSSIEKRSLRKLKNDGVLPYTFDEVKQWSNDYFEGKGLENFFNKK